MTVFTIHIGNKPWVKLVDIIYVENIMRNKPIFLLKKYGYWNYHFEKKTVNLKSTYFPKF